MDTLPPPARMHPAARLLRAVYAITPGLPLLQYEFGFYGLEGWYEQGLDRDADLAEEFGYDEPGSYAVGGLGWCEAAFEPAFTEEVLEHRGDCEVIRDHAGRHLLCFAGRRSGFMPEYLEHPVKDMATWERDVAWRLDPATPERWSALPGRETGLRAAAAEGRMIVQQVIGGYMYLRSLIGPEDLLYKFYDEPELIHACMRTWLALADAVTARHQLVTSFDELFFGEDICYNHGCLISPDMCREFLFPYYRELVERVRSRQLDRKRRLYIHLDTDGDARPVIDLYREEVGLDVLSPCEVAAGCDVVDLGVRYPDLVLKGGIDKRVLAEGPAAIDIMVERILPPLRARGGYVPTCDHGVPEEVSLANYRHYRRRALELGTG